MKSVIVTFTYRIDLSKSVQEMIDDGELEMTDKNIREFALECVQSDLQDISHSLPDTKFHTHITIFEDTKDEEGNEIEIVHEIDEKETK